MILRALAIAVGLGLLAATAHISIAQSGGYGTPHSFIALAVAAGVGIGAVTIGVAWSERRRGLAFAILVALLCGEAWGLIATGERIIAVREQIQAPLRDRAAQHRAAEAALRNAQAVKPLPADRSRLLAAQHRKQKADDAARDAATDKNCRDNCRLLLQAAVDAAFAEITAARNEIASYELAQMTDINNRIQTAAAALREIPMPSSAAPLADRLGLPSWTLDLMTAALGSIAANGLAACMLAFGVHKRRSVEVAPPASMPSMTATIEASPIAVDDLPPRLALPQPPIAPQITPPITVARPAPRRAKSALMTVEPIAETTTAPVQSAISPPAAANLSDGKTQAATPKIGEVMAFAAAQLYPDMRGTVLLTTAHNAYRDWCATVGYQPVDPGVFADEFAKIVRKLKLSAHMSPQGLIIRGASIPAAINAKSNAA
jgi:hypothetical protein